MTVRYEGEPIDSEALKAAMYKCETCDVSTLYMYGSFSGLTARTFAETHDDLNGNHEVVVYGFKLGDEFPDALVDKNTQYLSSL